MENETNIEKALAVLRILNEETDETHRISMPVLLQRLKEQGYSAERKSVYKALNALSRTGVEIHFSRKDGKQGYWIKHAFSAAEAMIIMDDLNASLSLSPAVTSDLNRRLLNQLSIYDREKLKRNVQAAGKTENDQVIHMIEILLEAIRQVHPVEFRYYDLTVTRQKCYRRNAQAYVLIPYAVVCSSGRYYCVFYSPKHHSFANYRIDKMERVRMLEEQADTVPFDLEQWMQTGFHMYQGEPATVTIEFDLSLASTVFDQFGKNILISSVTDHTFTANIPVSISPSLIAWLLPLTGRMTVKRPQALIDALKDIADSIEKTYNKE